VRGFRAARKRGGALITVLWLTAALTAIALSVGALVRSEVDRATGNYEGLQAYFLARAGVERFFYELERAPLPPETPARAIAGYMNRFGHIIRYSFPSSMNNGRSAEAVVEIVAESGKINLNRATPPQLEQLLLMLGVEPDRAQLITGAILDWRGSTAMPDAPSQFDTIYLQRQPSFRAPHASFQEVEELLLVHGVTPDLFYGGYRVAADGAFLPRPGLRDCVTTLAGPETSVDVMSAPAPVLAAFGIPLPLAEAFVSERQMMDIVPPERLQMLLQSTVMTPAAGRLTPFGGRTTYTIRSTARAAGTVRSVSAQIQLVPRPGAFYDVLRWEDQALPPQNLFPEKTQ